MSESGLADLLAPRIEALDAAGGNPDHRVPGFGDRRDKGADHGQGCRTVHQRTRCSTPSRQQVVALVGDSVFSADDRSMEEAVAVALCRRASPWDRRVAHRWTGGEPAGRGRRARACG